MKMLKNLYKHNNGFTLLELSITLLVLGILMNLYFSFRDFSNGSDASSANQVKVTEIEKALILFIANNGRLPCPASPIQAVDDQTFGKEQIDLTSNPAVCKQTNTGLLTGTLSGNDMLYYGAIPIRDLGLTDDYMFDSWGNRFGYFVQRSYTNNHLTNTSCVMGSAAQSNQSNNSYICFRGQATRTSSGSSGSSGSGSSGSGSSGSGSSGSGSSGSGSSGSGSSGSGSSGSGSSGSGSSGSGSSGSGSSGSGSSGSGSSGSGSSGSGSSGSGSSGSGSSGSGSSGSGSSGSGSSGSGSSGSGSSGSGSSGSGSSGSGSSGSGSSGSSSTVVSLQIRDSYNGNIQNLNPVYGIISHGANGYAAFRQNADYSIDNGGISGPNTKRNGFPPSSHVSELANTSCNPTTAQCADNLLNYQLIQAPPSPYFNDYVTFKSRNQLVQDCNNYFSNICTSSFDIYVN